MKKLLKNLSSAAAFVFFMAAAIKCLNPMFAFFGIVFIFIVYLGVTFAINESPE